MCRETNQFLEVDANMRFDLLWLRDNCRCEECFEYKILERNLNVLDVPDDISCKEHRVEDQTLIVNWSDGHKSTYELDFLSKFQPRSQIKPKTEMVLWDSLSIKKPMEGACRFTMTEMMSGKSNKAVLESLVKYGMVFVDGVSPNVVSTEFVIRQLFPFIKDSWLGKMWTLTNATFDHPTSAYTSGYLAPHTDGTFISEQAGLIAFHCVKHTGTGGETILIDGFQVAEKIRQEHPDVFERLCKTNFVSAFKEPGAHYSHAAPFFILDAETEKVAQIRYNHVHRSSTVATARVRQYYHDMKLLTKYVDDPANQVVLKLNPGCVLIIDNWRLLHGRTAYNGIRALTGCYVGHDEFMSVARVNDLID